MPVAINYNLCDQGKGCACIGACAQKAWSFNETSGKPEVDLSKCNNCFKCIKICPARAVLAATSEEGMKKLEEELAKYPANRSALVAPRFNAEPSERENQLTSRDFNEKVLSRRGIVLVEFWTNPCVSRCRMNAALYSDILPEQMKTALLYKVNALENTDLMVRFSLFTFPSIVIFNNGRVIDTVTGYTSISEKEALKLRLEKIEVGSSPAFTKISPRPISL